MSSLIRVIKTFKKRNLVSTLKLSFAFFISIQLNSTNSFSSTNSTETSPHSLGLAFGQVILTGDFAKNFSDSFGYALVYEYRASDMFGVYTDLGYSKHVDSSGKNILIIKDFNPNLKTNFTYFDELTLFGVAGFGLYHVNRTVFPASGSVTTLGFNAGPGFDLNLSNQFKFGAVITFHHLFTKADPDASNPAGNGMDIGGTCLRMMMNLRYVF